VSSVWGHAGRLVSPPEIDPAKGDRFFSAVARSGNTPELFLPARDGATPPWVWLGGGVADVQGPDWSVLRDRDLSTYGLPGLPADAGGRHPDLPFQSGSGRRGPRCRTSRMTREKSARPGSITCSVASPASRKKSAGCGQEAPVSGAASGYLELRARATRNRAMRGSARTGPVPLLAESQKPFAR